jgi:hypothetical protein
MVKDELVSQASDGTSYRMTEKSIFCSRRQGGYWKIQDILFLVG